MITIRAPALRSSAGLRGLWRWPEDHRCSSGSSLDPSLSGGGRAADPAPGVGLAEESASAAVRVRRLTCLVDRHPAPTVRVGAS